MGNSIYRQDSKKDTEKYRTGLKRIGASILDGFVFMPLLFLEQWIYKNTSNIFILFAWATFVGFAPLFYSVILHYKTGKTYGKWVAGVEVLDISETRKLTFLQSVYRDSFYLLIAIAGTVYYGFLLAHSESAEDVLSDYSSFSNNPVLWWTLLELITMLTNNKRRAVHDFLAKSVVVRTKTNS